MAVGVRGLLAKLQLDKFRSSWVSHHHQRRGYICCVQRCRSATKEIESSCEDEQCKHQAPCTRDYINQ